MLGRYDDIAHAAKGTDVLLLAPPDDAVASVAAAVEPFDSTLVMHVSGALGLDVLHPHTQVASVHPLMSLPDAATGAARLADRCWFAIDGDPAAGAVVEALKGRVLKIAATDRPLYHAIATVASNHAVALAGQVQRLADRVGVPFEAYLGLMAASIENVALTGDAATALTGPASRGDTVTIQHHLAALPADEVDMYLMLSGEAARLAGCTLSVTPNGAS